MQLCRATQWDTLKYGYALMFLFLLVQIPSFDPLSFFSITNINQTLSQAILLVGIISNWFLIGDCKQTASDCRQDVRVTHRRPRAEAPTSPGNAKDAIRHARQSRHHVAAYALYVRFWCASSSLPQAGAAYFDYQSLDGKFVINLHPTEFHCYMRNFSIEEYQVR